MWYGELYGELEKLEKNLKDGNFGVAKERIATIKNRMHKEGVIICAVLEKVGGEEYESING